MDGHIAIRLSPSEMSKPDTDIRYRLPGLVSELTQGRIADDGFDYTEDNTMIVYLSCGNPKRDVDTVIRILKDNTVCDNQLLDSAVIGVSLDGKTFDIIHPPDADGQFTVDPW